jgi:AbrB family looped-hinge helix DNA binding protein
MSKFSGPKLFGTVTVGERGQVVIPAQVRKLYAIKSGDKLVVFSKAGQPICFVPAEHFNDFLTHMSKMLKTIKKQNPDIQ